MFKCPKCNTEVDHIEYTVPTREFGTAQMSGKTLIHDSVRTEEYDNGVKYFCPVCQCALTVVDGILA
jgi:hypothetical protein